MSIDRSPKVLRRPAPVLLAVGAAMALILGACGSAGAEEGTSASDLKSAGPETAGGAGQSAGPETAGGAEPAGDAAGANTPAEGVFAGVPVIDGEISHDRSGTLTNGETDYRDIGVDTAMTWQAASELAREQLLGAGLVERAWATADKDRNQVNVRAVYENGDVVIQLQVETDGNVAYDAREMPAGSFAEQDFACGVLGTVAVEAPGVVTMMPLTSGEPVSSQDLDLTFGYADALEGRVPTEVSAALAGLRDAAEQAVGLPAEQTAAGTEVAEAVAAATATLADAKASFCSG